MEYALGTTTIYKTTKAKPLFPFQRFTMYCAQVENKSKINLRGAAVS